MPSSLPNAGNNSSLSVLIANISYSWMFNLFYILIKKTATEEFLRVGIVTFIGE